MGSRRCTMPPHCPNGGRLEEPLLGLPVYESRIRLNDGYCLFFEEPGSLFHFPLGQFAPEFPTGTFAKGCLPLTRTAIKEGEVYFLFTSFEDGQTYVHHLMISRDYEEGEDDCPSTDSET